MVPHHRLAGAAGRPEIGSSLDWILVPLTPGQQKGRREDEQSRVSAGRAGRDARRGAGRGGFRVGEHSSSPG